MRRHIIARVRSRLTRCWGRRTSVCGRTRAGDLWPNRQVITHLCLLVTASPKTSSSGRVPTEGDGGWMDGDVDPPVIYLNQREVKLGG